VAAIFTSSGELRAFSCELEEVDKIEKKTFGQDGFEWARDQVTVIEKELGIYDLAQFTPK
jgi:hypothetical protein